MWFRTQLLLCAYLLPARRVHKPSELLANAEPSSVNHWIQAMPGGIFLVCCVWKCGLFSFFLLKIYMFIVHSDLIQWKLIGCLPSSLGSSDEELSFPSQRVTWDGTMLLEISRGMHCKNVVAWHPALPWPGRAFCSAFRWTSLSHKTKALGLFTSVRQQQVWLPYTNKIAECSSGMWTAQSLRLEPWFWESLLYVSDAFTTSSVWLTHVTCPVQGLPSGFWSLTPRIIHSIQCPS